MPVPARFHSILVVLCALALQMSSARGAELLYDNSTDFPDPNAPWSVWYANSGLQIGDEIVLGTNITSHVLTELQLDYWGDFTPTGDEMGEVRLYQNDGPTTADGIHTPGTLLYDSGKFLISTNYESWKSNFLNITLPDDLTWTIQFFGLSGTKGDRAGLVFRDPPTVGSSWDDAWRQTDAGWQTVVFQNKNANFAARLTSDLPFITIRQISPDTLVVEWAGAAVLQEADEVEGPYTDRPQFRNKYTTTTHAAAAKFWRLRD